MTTKRTYKPKVQGYVPEAIDADGDGLVQDGTEFERPVGTELDTHIEVIVTELAKTHTIAEGENIQTVAAMHCPAGMTRNDYAKKLAQLNSRWSVGSVVRLG